MKNLTLIFASAALLTLNACSHTKPDVPAQGTGLTYRDLIIKDYDEMAALVKKHTKAAHKIVANSESNADWQRQAVSELTQAERIILSRPNSDNMVAKLTLEVRREMTDIGNYDDILQTMTREGVQAFDKSLELPTVMKTTYTFVLENLMSELRPEIKNDSRQRQMMEQIRDANLEIPYDVMRERKLQGMFLTESPSATAKRMLEEVGIKKGKK